MSKAEFKGQHPDTLYVVTYENFWRVFSSEGQAMRWYTLKVNEGLKPVIHKYTNPTIIAKVEQSI